MSPNARSHHIQLAWAMEFTVVYSVLFAESSVFVSFFDLNKVWLMLYLLEFSDYIFPNI